MEDINRTDSFPEQNESNKLHGTHDNSGQKEKYLRDSGKIEDISPAADTPKMNSDPDNNVGSHHLRDRSGEEKDEDYINTDERANDLKRRGLES